MFCKCILTPSLSFESRYLMFAGVCFVFASKQRMNVM